jgi:hypothetical protein
MGIFDPGLEQFGRPRAEITEPKQSPVGATLIEFGDWLLDQMKGILDSDGANASFELQQSLRFEVAFAGRKTTFTLFMEDYWEYVDQGVKGTGGGGEASVNNESEFQFAFDRPSEKHADALGGYIRNKGIRIRDPKGIPLDQQYRSLAYAMGTKTKRRGIRATRFFSDAATPSIIDVLAGDLSRAAGRQITVELITAIEEA